MKKVTVTKGSNVEVKPFVLESFTVQKETQDTVQKVTKKELKSLAKELGLGYDDESIAFAKKLLNAHLKKSV
jgi:hypothetical protein